MCTDCKLQVAAERKKDHKNLTISSVCKQMKDHCLGWFWSRGVKISPVARIWKREWLLPKPGLVRIEGGL